MLRYVLDESGFLAPHGDRALFAKKRSVLLVVLRGFPGWAHRRAFSASHFRINSRSAIS
jgi:hypothetical protein